MERKKKNDEQYKLNFWKDIPHKEGFKFLTGKMQSDFPESRFTDKNTVVYFWDSLNFDSKHMNAMRTFDSLAASLGEYSYNYIFATEMDETAAKDFLKRNGYVYKNFKVLGGMDDFISGVYHEKPPKFMRFGPKKDSTKRNPDCPDPRKMKIKGYYALMDKSGNIVYNNFLFFLPEKDTTLLRRLNTMAPVKSVKSLN